MNFKYGDMFWMGNHDFGTSLWMMINPPINCEHCGALLKDWELDEDGDLICPECSSQIKEFNRAKCSCGEHDLISLIVASNNNFHASNDEVVPYCDKVNFVNSVCQKSLEEGIKQGKIRKLSDDEAINRRRSILWTSSDDYVPGAPFPQWVIDRIK